jgi:hypothetical protein
MQCSVHDHGKGEVCATTCVTTTYTGSAVHPWLTEASKRLADLLLRLAAHQRKACQGSLSPMAYPQANNSCQVWECDHTSAHLEERAWDGSKQGAS